MKRTGGRGRVRLVSTGRSRCVSLAGAGLLTETARVVGLDRALSQALGRWRPTRAVLDPGKIVLDLAITLAVGGDCPADAAVLRAAPEVFGTVASDPTTSRLIHALAADLEGALAALRGARALARHRAHQLRAHQLGAHQLGAHRLQAQQLTEQPAGDRPAADRLVLDIDATIVEAFSAKQGATGTFKRTFGFAPMLAYLDHGPGGTGEPLAGLLRPGNANPHTAADHLRLLELATAQLEPGQASRLLVRTDSAGLSHELVAALTERKLQYSLGFSRNAGLAAALASVPDDQWRPARDHTGAGPSARAELVEVTESMSPRRSWPAGLRVIAKRQPLLPGTQLRLGDPDGYRISAFATNDPDPDIAALDLRHRQRARCEDRIRAAKTTGLRNLPYRDLDANAIWLEIVLLAQDLTAHTQQLALDGELRAAEPKRLRLRVFAVAARLVRTGRATLLDLDPHWPWTSDILSSQQRLHALAPG